MTGNSVASQTPTFTWMLPAGLTTAHVEICGTDNKCKTPTSLSPVTGAGGTAVSSTPSAVLPRGATFWRVVTTGGAPSPIWQFYAPGPNALKTASKASWPSFADIEGDGYADLLIQTGNGDTTEELQGSATGLQTVIAGSGAVGPGRGVGDIDGDGLTDYASIGNIPNVGPGVQVSFGSPTGFPQIRSQLVAAALGSVAVVAGDINGDGYADVVSTDGVNVYVADGSPTGLAMMPTQTFAVPAASIAFNQLAAVGDINGDGYADVVAGDQSAATVGRAYVYLGGPTGLATSPKIMNAPIGAGGTFGEFVAEAGDLNGDGYCDVVISANGTTIVYVYYGSMGGLPASPQVTYTPGSGGLKTTPWGAGDVNGDGYSDLLLTGAGLSKTVFYFGGPQGVPASAASPSATLAFGFTYFQLACGFVGDLNGDGLSDFATGRNSSGNIDVIYGTAGTFPMTPNVTLPLSFPPGGGPPF